MISVIVAAAANDVIGEGSRLPWRLPADLRHFKKTTMGKPVLMGRTTYESIGRPLPGRFNIVLTTDRGFAASGCTVVHSIEEALQAAAGHEELMVIGGASIYRQFLPMADRLYLTRVHHEFAGDTRFPEMDHTRWRELSREDHGADERNPYPYSFLVYERADREPTAAEP